MKFNLHTKLIGSFSIVLILMVVVGLVGIYTSKQIQYHLEDTVELDAKVSNLLGIVARRVGFVHSNSLLHLFTMSIDDMDRYESEIVDWEAKINRDIDTLKIMLEDQVILNKLAEFSDAWDTYFKIWCEQVMPLSRTNRDEKVFSMVRKRGVAGVTVREAMYTLEELHDAIFAAAGYNLELAERDFRKNQIILIATVLFAIILGLIFGIKQSSLIADAVNTVSRSAQKMATGDIDQSVTVKTGDEIEVMADSFNKMAGNMKKMVGELQQEITERKRAEEELKKHREHLEELVKERTTELRKHREHLEELVKERTTELQEKNKELKRYNKLFEGREFRIKDLKDKIKELEKKLEEGK